MQTVLCEIIDVTDTHVVLKNDHAIWWLGSENTFKLPKDSSLTNAKIGDMVNIKLEDED